MSKVKAKKEGSSSKTQQATSTEKKNTVQLKRKQWMVEKFKKMKPPPVKQEKPKAPQQAVPPKDAVQFSANWKALQEVCHLNNTVCLAFQ